VSVSTVPKWLDKIKGKDNKKDEKNWAKRRNGRVRASSGRFWWAKFDTIDDQFLTDCKETSKLSYSISLGLWKALTQMAIKEGKIPCMKVKFVQGGQEILILPASLLENNKNEF
jgi:hypothetical protein